MCNFKKSSLHTVNEYTFDYIHGTPLTYLAVYNARFLPRVFEGSEGAHCTWVVLILYL